MQPIWKTCCQYQQTHFMKRILIPVLSFAFCGSFFACKNEQTNSCSLMPAKIIRFDCDRVIFQLLTNDFAGDAEWTDVHTGNRYNNVVYWFNNCGLSAGNHDLMDTVYINPERITVPRYPENCVQCQAVSSNPPQTMVEVTEISDAPCNTAGNGR